MYAVQNNFWIIAVPKITIQNSSFVFNSLQVIVYNIIVGMTVLESVSSSNNKNYYYISNSNNTIDSNNKNKNNSIFTL